MIKGRFLFKKYKNSAEKYFENRDKGRGSGYKQFKRWEYMALRMMDENGYLRPDSEYIEEWKKLNRTINENSHDLPDKVIIGLN
ncbi:MAG: hypothetical protein R2771_04990 [Saprospiraceae bacterium]